MAEEADPGVTTPPVDPGSGNEPTAPSVPPGGEAVTSTGKTEEQTVPFTRFQEVNDKAKSEAEARAALQEELDTLKAQQNQTSQNDEDVDPDVLDLVKKSANKLGFVSKEELNAREAQIQVRQDINDLTSQYKDSGIPFDGQKIIEYAKANGMQVTSKKSLDAIYKEMNYDAIIEANRKSAVTDFQESGKAGGEKPGSKGAEAPKEPQAGSLKDRIKAAREKVGATIT